MINIFEINNKQYSETIVNETVVYEIENFYKYPDKILEFVSHIQPFYHKEDQASSFNGVAFKDMRHRCQVKGMESVCEFLSGVCKQQPQEKHSFCTNVFKLLDRKFNRYSDNYWWPHIDIGYTALIYLNNFSYSGTNLYSALKEPDYNKGEHYKPWQPKSDWKIEATIEAKFNKLVMFDGLNNPHAMVINSNLFYNKTRLNQVVFFKS
jgi:hypothetical protein